MKKLLTLVFLLIGHSGFPQTQNEMNAEAQNAFMAADKELNDVYKAIIHSYKEDTVFIKNLRATQIVWVKFRETELRMKYPIRPAGYYGSIQPLCEAKYNEQLTLERVKTLKQWLNGKEGDGCLGSVKLK